MYCTPDVMKMAAGKFELHPGASRRITLADCFHKIVSEAIEIVQTYGMDIFSGLPTNGHLDEQKLSDTNCFMLSADAQNIWLCCFVYGRNKLYP